MTTAMPIAPSSSMMRPAPQSANNMQITIAVVIVVVVITALIAVGVVIVILFVLKRRKTAKKTFHTDEKNINLNDITNPTYTSKILCKD